MGDVVNLGEARAKREAKILDLTFVGRLINAVSSSLGDGLVAPDGLADHLCPFVTAILLGMGWTPSQISERMMSLAQKAKEDVTAEKEKTP